MRLSAVAVISYIGRRLIFSSNVCSITYWLSSLISTLFFFFQFTFAKMWLLYAQFEIRQKNLPLARRALVSFYQNYN